MAIRADSYSSTTEVKAFTRHLLDGELAFNDLTRPTATELEKFIDRASGVLNAALAQAGLTTPITNTTAKLACDDFVTTKAAQYVELTQRGAGTNEGENERGSSFHGLYGAAIKFVEDYMLGFQNLGVDATHPASQGVTFTGLTIQEDRTDQDDTTLEQPVFIRHKWDNN